MSLDEGCFQRCLVSDSVILKPHRIGRNVKEVILAKLCETFEGVCSRHGYILPSSIRLHRASPGSLEGANLNGDVRYDLQYHAMVCNPAIGSVIAARVVNMTRFGFLLHSGAAPPKGGDAVAPLSSIVETIVSRQATFADLSSSRAHVGGGGNYGGGSDADLMDTGAEDNEEDMGGPDANTQRIRQVVDLDNIQIGDVVNIRVMGKKFQLNDRHISVVGRIVERAPDKPVGQVPVIGDNNEEDQLVIAATELSADERDDDGGQESGDEADDSEKTEGVTETDDDRDEEEEEEEEEEQEKTSSDSGSSDNASSTGFRRVRKKGSGMRKAKGVGEKVVTLGSGKARKSDERDDSDEGDDSSDDDDDDDAEGDVDGDDGELDADDVDDDGDDDEDGDDGAKQVSDDDDV